MKIVIVGGVAAGMSAAAKIKRDNPSFEVIVLEKGFETSYGACGLPYYISDVNPVEELLRIRRAEEFIKSGIDVRLGNEVIKLEPNNKTITILDENNNEYMESYDICIIATGASAIVPKLEGVNLKNVFTLKTIEDANKIKSAINDKIKNVVIVGGGYIGIELVETFHHLGKKITLIERLDHIMQSFDPDMSDHIKTSLINQGVDIRCSETLVKVEGTDFVNRVVTDKAIIDADMVILALGVRPNTSFLEGTGVEMLQNGAIVVDERMKTNIDSIYACGDCATIYHRILKKNVFIPLGTNANKQGRLVAKSIKGEDFRLEVALGSAMMKVNNLECARTGLSEAEARSNGINYGVHTITAQTHAPYYPDSKEIRIKIVYRKPDKVLLGAQLIGEKDVAWRMNTLAVCIHNEMTLDEISLLDLGYAPPYSMPWDAIHIVAQSVKE